MKAPLWIEIPRWDEFQHYKNRDPIWIRNYVRQLNDPDYLNLTFAQRGLLHDLRLLYAMTRRDIRLDTAGMTRRLGGHVSATQLTSLNQAGLLRIVASKPLAKCFPRLEVEKKEPLHVKSDKPNQARRPACPKCGTTLAGPRSLAEHLYLQHGGPEPVHWLEAEEKAHADQ